MVEQEGFVRRPFYEVIVDLIRDDPIENDRGMVVIGRLLMEAKIPKGHDGIITALKEKIPSIDLDKEVDLLSGDDFWTGVARDILAQKREAEAEARAKEAKAQAEALDKQRTEARLLMEDALGH